MTYLRITLFAGPLVAIATICSSAESQASSTESAWAGIGASSCGEFSEMYRSDPNQAEFMFFSWAQGFMSGLNTGTFNTDKGTAN
jgi:hypothetical protein